MQIGRMRQIILYKYYVRILLIVWNWKLHNPGPAPILLFIFLCISPWQITWCVKNFQQLSEGKCSFCTPLIFTIVWDPSNHRTMLLSICKIGNWKSPQTSPFIFLQGDFFQAQYLDFGFWIHISHLKSLQYECFPPGPQVLW